MSGSQVQAHKESPHFRQDLFHLGGIAHTDVDKLRLGDFGDYINQITNIIFNIGIDNPLFLSELDMLLGKSGHQFYPLFHQIGNLGIPMHEVLGLRNLL